MPEYILLAFILFISACVSSDVAYVTFGNATISAEVADSQEERQRGLMNKDYLAPNTGMLFIFPDEAPRSFWMKNTKIPLDIIFIPSNFTIADIQSMEPCLEEPCKLYVSKEAAKYALEVNKGFAEKHGTKIGARMEISFK